MERKTKGKIDLEKVSLFHFWSLAGFLDVRECLSRMLSDYNAAPAAGENISTVWPCVTSWQGQGLHQVLTLFAGNEVGHFTLKRFPWMWRAEITFRKFCLRGEWIHTEEHCFVISRPIPDPAGKGWNCIHSWTPGGRDPAKLSSVRF